MRRRSSVGFDEDVTIQLDEEPSPTNEKVYERSILEKIKGEREVLGAIGGGKGYLAWTDGKVASRRGGFKRCIALLALLIVCVLGWLGGLATSEVSSRKGEAGVASFVRKQSKE